MKEFNFTATIKGKIQLQDLDEDSSEDYSLDRAIDELNGRLDLVRDAFDAEVAVAICENKE